MLEATLILTVLLAVFLSEASGRGIRIQGVSWFEVAHQMRGTSKKARGRIQRKPCR